MLILYLIISILVNIQCELEFCSELIVEGVEENVFERRHTPISFFELSPALGLPDINPIGRSVGSPRETISLNKGFQEQGTVAVLNFPVLGQLFGGGGQDSGSEVAHSTAFAGADEQHADDRSVVILKIR